MDTLVDFEPIYPGFESRYKFNITVSTQILLLYYPLWCPGLQRFDSYCVIVF